MAKMKPCNTCPFRKNSPNHGSAEWLIDVMKGLMAKNLEHSCHKTDPNADGYVGHQAGKDSICIGAVAMIKADSNRCYDNRVKRAIFEGRMDWDDVSTEGVFQRCRDFVKHHLRPFEKEVPRGTK